MIEFNQDEYVIEQLEALISDLNSEIESLYRTIAGYEEEVTKEKQWLVTANHKVAALTKTLRDLKAKQR